MSCLPDTETSTRWDTGIVTRLRHDRGGHLEMASRKWEQTDPRTKDKLCLTIKVTLLRPLITNLHDHGRPDCAVSACPLSVYKASPARSPQLLVSKIKQTFLLAFEGKQWDLIAGYKGKGRTEAKAKKPHVDLQELNSKGGSGR